MQTRQKAVVITFIAVFVAIIAVVIIVNALPSNNFARITGLEYKAVVIDERQGDNGKVRITERLTFEIHAASRNNAFWELWRALPEEYVDGVRVEYRVIGVRRLTVNGRPDFLEFGQASRLYWYDYDYISTQPGLGPNRWFHSRGPYDGVRNFESLMIYVDGLYRETVVFEIEYEMYNASLRYADCSELYLTLWSGPSVRYLNNVSGQILIPQHKMPREGNFSAHTFGTNSHTFAFTQSVTYHAFDFYQADPVMRPYHTFSFTLDESQLRFRPYNQYIEFLLLSFGEDKHSFTQFASVNAFSNAYVLEELRQAKIDYEALPARFTTIKIIVLIALTLAAALTVYLVCCTIKASVTSTSFSSRRSNLICTGKYQANWTQRLRARLCFAKTGFQTTCPAAVPPL